MIEAKKKIQRVFQGVVVSKKFKVHDENGQAKTGNVVLFVETRPISKEKRWRLAKIVK